MIQFDSTQSEVELTFNIDICFSLHQKTSHSYKCAVGYLTFNNYTEQKTRRPVFVSLHGIKTAFYGCSPTSLFNLITSLAHSYLLPHL